MKNKRIPRKIKKALKSLLIKNTPCKSSSCKITDFQKNFRHKDKVVTHKGISVTGRTLSYKQDKF